MKTHEKKRKEIATDKELSSQPAILSRHMCEEEKKKASTLDYRSQ